MEQLKHGSSRHRQAQIFSNAIAPRTPAERRHHIVAGRRYVRHAPACDTVTSQFFVFHHAYGAADLLLGAALFRFA
jgi:hypothetical protein